MFAAINAFFAMFVRLFQAGEKAAAGIDNLAAAGEKMSQVYLAEREHELKQRVLKLEAETAKVKQLTK
jgi:hypothetical protein